jgi:hypothetical protein
MWYRPRRLLWRTLGGASCKRTSSQAPSPEDGGTPISTETAWARLADLGHRVVGIGASEALVPCGRIRISL